MQTYVPCQSCGALNRVRLEMASGKSPVCRRCQTALAIHGAVVPVTGQGLNLLIGRSPVPVVVDFWADWCAPCRMFAPIFEQAAERLAGEAVLAKLDTERERDAAGRFEIRSIPTVILFRGGTEVKRLSGALLLEPFLQWIRQEG